MTNNTNAVKNPDSLTDENAPPLVQSTEAENQTKTTHPISQDSGNTVSADSVPLAEASSLEVLIDSMICATPLDTANPPRDRWNKGGNKDAPVAPKESVTAAPGGTLQPMTVETNMDQRNCTRKTTSSEIVFPPALQRSSKSVEEKAQQSLADECDPDDKDEMVPPGSEATVDEDANSTDAKQQSNPSTLTPGVCYTDVCCWK